MCFRSVFAAISDVSLEKQHTGDSDSDQEGGAPGETGRRSSASGGDRSRGPSAMSQHFGSNTPPPKIDKRLTQHHVSYQQHMKVIE